MKNIIILLAFIIYTTHTIAQTAEFEITLYFEDAMGNKDSVIMGYDAAVVSNETPNALFGEAAITTLFDTVLDVRVTNDVRDWAPHFYSKKMIAGYGLYNGCPNTFFGYIVPYVKYPPLKMIYDKQQVLNLCTDHGMVLFNNSRFLMINPFVDYIADYTFYCMNQFDTIVLDNSIIDTCQERHYNITNPIVTLNGNDTVHSYLLTKLFKPEANMRCQSVGILEDVTSLEMVSFYPNPASGSLKVDFAEHSEYKIYAADARVVATGSIIEQSISIDCLSAGLYNCYVYNDSNKGRFSFVKH
jgi:hypothetical protein